MGPSIVSWGAPTTSFDQILASSPLRADLIGVGGHPCCHLAAATTNPTAASVMEVVLAVKTLEGEKEWFDLGIFVGNLALNEEVTR
jgi:hypothetical protein